MKLILYGFIALAIMGAIGTGVYKVKEWGATEVRAEWAEAVRVQTEADLEKSTKAATNLESDRAKTKIIYKTIKDRVVTYVDRPIYSSTCFDADGLRDANGAILRTSPDSGKPLI